MNDNSPEPEPEPEESHSLISRLPYELLVSILAQIAIDSPKKFVKTLLIGRELSIPYRSALLWEPICRNTYPELETGQIDVDDYGGYYELFQKRPTIRYNGVYVCVARYYREGEIEGISFYRPLHEVKYYRYLWLLPNGGARSLLSNSPPRKVLGPEAVTNPSVMRDTMYGKWTLDTESKKVNITVDGGTKRKHFFCFLLEVASSGGKCHNKLKWHRYWSEDHESRTPSEFSLVNEGSYYFYKLPKNTIQEHPAFS